MKKTLLVIAGWSLLVGQCLAMEKAKTTVYFKMEMEPRAFAELTLIDVDIPGFHRPTKSISSLSILSDGSIKLTRSENGKISAPKNLGKIPQLSHILNQVIEKADLKPSFEIGHLSKMKFPWMPKWSDIPAPCMEPAIYFKVRMRNNAPTLAAFTYNCQEVDQWFNDGLTDGVGYNQYGIDARAVMEILLKLAELEKRF